MVYVHAFEKGEGESPPYKIGGSKPRIRADRKRGKKKCSTDVETKEERSEEGGQPTEDTLQEKIFTKKRGGSRTPHEKGEKKKRGGKRIMC